MKNILILATVGGFLDKFEKGNVRILRSMGYTVHYAANMREKHYLFEEEAVQKLGVHIHHIDIARSPYMLNYNLKAVDQLQKIIKENDIHAIHCHTPVGGMLGRIMGLRFKKQGLQIVYTAHGFHFYKGAPFINNTVYYLVEKVLARYTDILVVINKEDYISAKKKLHLRRGGRVYRIPGVGLDLDRFAPMQEGERERIRKTLGIRPDDFFIVSVGELNENKNQQIILHTLAQMKKEGINLAHIRYGICGEGFLRSQLETQIRELGLQDTVTMYGYCMHVEGILGCADVSVFPSVREGLGMAGLEALAMGIPLLASDNRGTREYLKPEINGYFCKCDEVRDWINGIQNIRGMSQRERQEMEAMCRKSAESFGQENTDSIMELVYQDLDKRLGSDQYGKDKNQCDHGNL